MQDVAVTDDHAAGPAREGRPLEPAGVLLLVMSIALLYVGGLTLLTSAAAPPIGPEDDVTTASWAVPLVVGLVGVPVALVRRATLTRLTLFALGCATVGPSLLLLSRHLSSGRTTVDDVLLVVPLGVGTIAVLVASMKRRARPSQLGAEASDRSSS